VSVQITDKQLLDEIAAAKAQADEDERARIERAVANTAGLAAKADTGVDVLRGILGARGWNERAGQIRMTQYVDEAHDDEDGGVPKRVGIVGVVAPVGTGKTLGYLAPALARGERVIIATSTKALQDQIVGEELPRLREDMINAFGRHITYSVMKGKSNYACLGAETRVITHDGTFPIRDLAGTVATVLDGDGDWVDAPIKDYGEQRLFRITLTGPGRKRRVVRATADHRWFLNENIGTPGFTETTTEALRPGDRLAYAARHPVAASLRPSQFGVAHGIVFGDGTVFGATPGGFRTGTVVLHGGKRELSRYFSESEQHPGANEKYSEPFIRVCDLPNHFKTLPSLDEAPSYLYGWLAGYCATDGHVSDSGTVTLSSAKREHVDFAEAVANRLGIATYGVSGGVRGEARKGRGSADGEMYSLPLNNKTLGPEFYLRSKHRKHGPKLASADMRNYKRWLRARRWIIESVEEDTVETVYCAEVPTTQSFVLEGNILTGNCLAHVDETIARFASHLGTSSDNDLLGGVSGDTELDGLVRISRHTRLAMARGDVVNFDTDLMLQRLGEDTRRGVTAKHACPIRRIPLEDCNVCVEGSGAEGHCQKIEAIAKDDRDVWRSAYCRAMLADVVVMNTALLVEEVTKQNNKASPAVPSVLEGVGMVVIDEAHHAPGIVTQSFSREINRKAAIGMARALDKRIADLDIETMMTMFFNSIDSADEEIKKISEFSEYAAKTCNSFAERASALLDRKARGATEAKGKSQAAVTEFRDDVIDTIKEIGGLAARKSVRGETSVHSARLSVDFLPDGSDFTLTAVPIDVSFFRERLVSAMSGVGTHSVRPKSNHKTIVLCSGTMNATTPRLLGFGGGSVVKTVESPFDPQRARLCVPADLPLPKTEEWEAAAWAKAEQAVLATEGRTLFLCTSNKMVQAFSLRAKGLPFTVLKQGDGSRADLVRRFAQDEHSVLVATMGYWEGIDVPGPALSLVVLDKIPFPVPSDPIATARREWVEAEGGNAFSIVDVGHASTMLAQGSGRLIRAESDAGGVLILDSRLANARYGSMALSQIERGWLFYRSLDPFLDWMKAVTAAHALGDTESVLDYRRDAEPIRARRKEFVR